MKYIKAICKCCGKEYEKATGPVNKGILAGGLKYKARSFKSVTCSKECSRKYNYNNYSRTK